MYLTFEFEDAVQMNKREPRHFQIPSEQRISNLVSGDLVKLIFIFKFETEDGCRAERMWVEITQFDGSSFKGILTNKPYYIKEVKVGSEIVFEKKHIAAIYFEQSSGIDEGKFAIITLRAIEKKEINWCVLDEPHDDQDSGWQMFYGDEDEEYLDDSSNAKLLTLSRIMAFEPLLEPVFQSNWGAAEYNEKTNSFIQARK